MRFERVRRGTKVVLSTTLGVWEKTDDDHIKCVWGQDEMVGTESKVEPDAFVFVIFDDSRRRRPEPVTIPEPISQTRSGEGTSIVFVDSEEKVLKQINGASPEQVGLIEKAEVVRLKVGGKPSTLQVSEMGYDVDENTFYIELH